MRPYGGSTINDVRAPVCFIVKNTVLLSVPFTSFTVPRSRRESPLL
jgi:hypothetical protein